MNGNDGCRDADAFEQDISKRSSSTTRMREPGRAVNMPDSSRQHQLQLMQHDNGNALLHLCISVLSMAYLAQRGLAEQQQERIIILALMLVEAAALLMQACSTGKGSAAAGFYMQHRTMCVLVLQSIEFAANLAYIPRAFALNVAIQLADGKYHHVLWNSLVSGELCSAQTPCMQLDSFEGIRIFAGAESLCPDMLLAISAAAAAAASPAEVCFGPATQHPLLEH
jgi:hypothetical protein